MKKPAASPPSATTTTPTQRAHEKAAARASETESGLATARAEHEAATAAFARFHDASENARKAFDADPSGKPAYLAAKRAEADARADVDRASRLVAKAEEAHATATADALVKRRAWLDARVSPDAAAELRVPVLELVEAARGLLERAWELDGTNGAKFREAIYDRNAFVAAHPSALSHDASPAAASLAATNASPARLYPSLSSLYADQGHTLHAGPAAAWSRGLSKLFSVLAQRDGVPRPGDS